MNTTIDAYRPQANEKGILDFATAIRFLEAKYNFNHYGYLEPGQVDPNKHFEAWCDAKGYTANMTDPEGKRRGSSQIWFAEYAADPNGEDTCPEVQNFWHWLLSFMNPGGGFNVPTTFKMNIADVLANYDATVAVENAARVANVVAGMESIMRILPPEFKKVAARQVSSMDIKLPAYVRTILGYFQAEFGPKVKLGFPKERF
jgi:hypothetical protein